MVAYDLMKEQIKKEISDYLDLNPEKADINKPRNLYDPIFSYKQGKIKVTIFSEKLSRENFLDAFDILKKYYQNFSGLRTEFNGYELTAELKNSRCIYPKPEKEELKDNNMVVEFGFDKYISLIEGVEADDLAKSNVITFQKEVELKQEEINCVLDVWRKFAVNEPEKKTDPKQELISLGMTVYEANEEFTWDSLAGYEGIKQQIKDTVILPFKHPEIYDGIVKLTRTKDTKNIVRAVLFEGPPGTGKTVSAKIIGNDTRLPLIYVPIESIMSCWYGVAEKRLASVFRECSRLENGILFLDEIDSLAGSRDKEMHEATRRILSVLLREIEGFSSSDNILTIGATNVVGNLDHALLSRFDRIISFPLPNQNERSAIFNYYARHLSKNDALKLARETDKNSGRDIEDICSDAERVWAREVISSNIELTAPPLESYLEALKQGKKHITPDKIMGFNANNPKRI